MSLLTDYETIEHLKYQLRNCCKWSPDRPTLGNKKALLLQR